MPINWFLLDSIEPKKPQILYHVTIGADMDADIQIPLGLDHHRTPTVVELKIEVLKEL